MKTKTAKPETEDKNEERFFHFAKALIAVPKKELDKEIAKEGRAKNLKHSKRKG